jgi:16S rRNA processing protein RimM
MPDRLLEVGRIGRAHGIAGDVWVELTTDRTERVAVGSRLWDGTQWRTVTASSLANGRWRVHFEGIDDRNAAEAMARRVLSAEPIEDPDVMWVHDLIGAEVVEADGTGRGRCVAVVDNPASDLLELDSGALVPVRFVTSVDGGVITIDPPEGLFDLFEG